MYFSIDFKDIERRGSKGYFSIDFKEYTDKREYRVFKHRL